MYIFTLVSKDDNVVLSGIVLFIFSLFPNLLENLINIRLSFIQYVH